MDQPRLNIVDMIESNPITKLTDTYNVKLLDKMKSNFTDFEQHLFITSFYCYLNYDKTKDFVIDLDDVWKWMGFSQKVSAIRVVEKHFKVDEDYVILLYNLDKQEKEQHGGHNIKKIMMNIRCFKSLCLKAQTKKASQIHEYYLKMEEILQEVVDEECVELRLKITEQEKQLDHHKKELKNVDKDKCLLREKTLLSQFPDNVQCVYIGMIDNILSSSSSSKKEEQLIKFGCSNFFADRVKSHKSTYNNFRLCAAYRVCNKTQVENDMKIHPVLIQHLRKLKIKKIEHKEILSTKNISIDKIDEIIRDIIQNIEFTPENYTKLLQENQDLKKENQLLKTHSPELYAKLVTENTELKRTCTLLQEQRDDEHKLKHQVFSNLVQERNKIANQLAINIHSSSLPEHSCKHNETTNKKKYRGIRQPDGLYYLEDGVFSQLEGTRQEVWDGTASKTSGGLKKQHLTIGADGIVVSKAKSISSAADNRLMTYMKKIGKV